MKNNILRMGTICGIVILFTILSISTSMSTTKDNFNEKTLEGSKNYFNKIYFTDENYINAYWKFDEGAGSTAHDSSDHGYDGTIYGASWVAHDSDYALDFDGQDDYVSLDDYATNALGFNKTDDLIFSFDFKSTSDGIIFTISASSSLNPGVIFSLKSDGTLEFIIRVLGCGLTLTSEGTYDDGSWHHAELIYNGISANPTATLYVDEELDITITEWVCAFTADGFKKAKIGKHSFNSTDYFDGQIDEFKIIKYPGGNQQNPPSISGPDSGESGIEYTYKFVTNDPEEDDIRLYVEWGDGTNTGWIGPFESGEEVTLTHSWSTNGKYDVRAKSKDNWHESIWAYYTVRIGDQGPDAPIIDGPHYKELLGEEYLYYDLILADNFENNFGWTVENHSTGGGWERGVPVGGGDRGDPPTDYDGSGKCFLTENKDNDSDVDNGYTYLISPAFDLSEGEYAFVDYACWYTNNYGYWGNRDYFYIYVSDNDGSDWTLVKTIGPSTPQPVEWKKYNFIVNDFVSLTDEVKVRFEASDTGRASTVEAGIDAFKIYLFDSASTDDKFTFCAEDYEGDDVYYWIDWGDGEIDKWIGPYNSGEEVKLSHLWSDHGEYTISAKAKDEVNLESDWSYFSVRVGNNPPNAPTIKGPDQGEPGEELIYKFSAIDHDDDNIYYWILAGNGQTYEDFGPYESGAEIELTFTYPEEGEFIIEAWVRDEIGAESEHTTLPIKIPKNKSLSLNINEINWFLIKIPRIFFIFKNLIGSFI